MRFEEFMESNHRRKSRQKFVVEVCLPLRGNAVVVQACGVTAGWVMWVSSVMCTPHVDSYVLSSE